MVGFCKKKGAQNWAEPPEGHDEYPRELLRSADSSYAMPCTRPVSAVSLCSIQSRKSEYTSQFTNFADHFRLSTTIKPTYEGLEVYRRYSVDYGKEQASPICGGGGCLGRRLRKSSFCDNRNDMCRNEAKIPAEVRRIKLMASRHSCSYDRGVCRRRVYGAQKYDTMRTRVRQCVMTKSQGCVPLHVGEGAKRPKSAGGWGNVRVQVGSRPATAAGGVIGGRKGTKNYAEGFGREVGERSVGNSMKVRLVSEAGVVSTFNVGETGAYKISSGTTGVGGEGGKYGGSFEDANGNRRRSRKLENVGRQDGSPGSFGRSAGVDGGGGNVRTGGGRSRGGDSSRSGISGSPQMNNVSGSPNQSQSGTIIDSSSTTLAEMGNDTRKNLRDLDMVLRRKDGGFSRIRFADLEDSAGGFGGVVNAGMSGGPSAAISRMIGTGGSGRSGQRGGRNNGSRASGSGRTGTTGYSGAQGYDSGGSGITGSNGNSGSYGSSGTGINAGVSGAYGSNSGMSAGVSGGFSSGGMNASGTGGYSSGGMSAGGAGGYNSSGMNASGAGGYNSGGMNASGAGGYSLGGMNAGGPGAFSSGGLNTSGAGGYSSGGLNASGTGGYSSGGMSTGGPGAFSSGGLNTSGAGGYSSGGMNASGAGGYNSGGMNASGAGGYSSGGMSAGGPGAFSSGGLNTSGAGGYSSGGMNASGPGGYNSGGTNSSGAGGYSGMNASGTGGYNSGGTNSSGAGGYSGMNASGSGGYNSGGINASGPGGFSSGGMNASGPGGYNSGGTNFSEAGGYSGMNANGPGGYNSGGTNASGAGGYSSGGMNAGGPGAFSSGGLNTSGAGGYSSGGLNASGTGGYNSGGTNASGAGGFNSGGMNASGAGGYNSGGTNASGAGGFNSGGMNASGAGGYNSGGTNASGAGGYNSGGTNASGAGRFSSGGMNASGAGEYSSDGMNASGPGGFNSGGLLNANGVGGYNSGGLNTNRPGGYSSGGMSAGGPGGFSSGGLNSSISGGYSSGGIDSGVLGGGYSSGMNAGISGGYASGGISGGKQQIRGGAEGILFSLDGDKQRIQALEGIARQGASFGGVGGMPPNITDFGSGGIFGDKSGYKYSRINEEDTNNRRLQQQEKVPKQDDAGLGGGVGGYANDGFSSGSYNLGGAVNDSSGSGGYNNMDDRRRFTPREKFPRQSDSGVGWGGSGSRNDYESGNRNVYGGDDNNNNSNGNRLRNLENVPRQDDGGVGLGVGNSRNDGGFGSNRGLYGSGSGASGAGPYKDGRGMDDFGNGNRLSTLEKVPRQDDSGVGLGAGYGNEGDYGSGIRNAYNVGGGSAGGYNKGAMDDYNNGNRLRTPEKVPRRDDGGIGLGVGGGNDSEFGSGNRDLYGRGGSGYNNDDFDNGNRLRNLEKVPRQDDGGLSGGRSGRLGNDDYGPGNRGLFGNGGRGVDGSTGGPSDYFDNGNRLRTLEKVPRQDDSGVGLGSDYGNDGNYGGNDIYGGGANNRGGINDFDNGNRLRTLENVPRQDDSGLTGVGAGRYGDDGFGSGNRGLYDGPGVGYNGSGPLDELSGGRLRNLENVPRQDDGNLGGVGAGRYGDDEFGSGNRGLYDGPGVGYNDSGRLDELSGGRLRNLENVPRQDDGNLTGVGAGRYGDDGFGSGNRGLYDGPGVGYNGSGPLDELSGGRLRNLENVPRQDDSNLTGVGAGRYGDDEFGSGNRGLYDGPGVSYNGSGPLDEMSGGRLRNLENVPRQDDGGLSGVSAGRYEDAGFGSGNRGLYDVGGGAGGFGNDPLGDFDTGRFRTLEKVPRQDDGGLSGGRRGNNDVDDGRGGYNDGVGGDGMFGPSDGLGADDKRRLGILENVPRQNDDGFNRPTGKGVGDGRDGGPAGGRGGLYDPGNEGRNDILGDDNRGRFGPLENVPRQNDDGFNRPVGSGRGNDADYGSGGRYGGDTPYGPGGNNAGMDNNRRFRQLEKVPQQDDGGLSGRRGNNNGLSDDNNPNRRLGPLEKVGRQDDGGLGRRGGSDGNNGALRPSKVGLGPDNSGRNGSENKRSKLKPLETVPQDDLFVPPIFKRAKERERATKNKDGNNNGDKKYNVFDKKNKDGNEKKKKKKYILPKYKLPTPKKKKGQDDSGDSSSSEEFMLVARKTKVDTTTRTNKGSFDDIDSPSVDAISADYLD